MEHILGIYTCIQGVLISFKAYRDKCRSRNWKDLLSQIGLLEREREMNPMWSCIKSYSQVMRI